jgi:hypothetical protein
MPSMRPRPLSLAALISALLCAATLTLWILTATSTRKIILLNTNPALYAWHEGLGLRVATPHAVHGSDIGYFPVAALTLLLPGIWLWRRLLRDAGSLESADRAARSVKKQIHFLLPDSIAVFLLVGVTALAIDARHPSVYLFAIVMYVALIANLVSRHKLKTKLNRLLTGHCPACGYNLTANTSGTCPECGTPSSSSA